ncbi:MAG: CDP-alcohol phosphatidyltransferase family protein [Bacteroidota bacterium]
MNKAAIPNSLTATNLFCGCLALMCIGLGEVEPATFLVVFALLMDFLDGFVARMLGVTSNIGKELDSLADMVTFGVVPGFIMALLIREAQGYDFLPGEFWQEDQGYLFLLALLVPVFSAVRLARFNLDERQSDAFFGLPTPANTILIFAYWLILRFQPDHWLAVPLREPWVLVGLSLLSSYLLVADIKLIALKFKDFGWKGNEFRYTLIVSTLIILPLFRFAAIPFLILLYFLLSLVANQREKVTA